MTNPYKVLGVHRDSTDEEIKVAYYRIAKETHPDKGVSPKKRDTATIRRLTDRFVEASQAYAAIKTAKERHALSQTYSLTSAVCSTCSGTGTKRTQKGLFHAVITPCAACGGAGYMTL